MSEPENRTVNPKKKIPFGAIPVILIALPISSFSKYTTGSQTGETPIQGCQWTVPELFPPFPSGPELLPYLAAKPDFQVLREIAEVTRQRVEKQDLAYRTDKPILGTKSSIPSDIQDPSEPPDFTCAFNVTSILELVSKHLGLSPPLSPVQDSVQNLGNHLKASGRWGVWSGPNPPPGSIAISNKHLEIPPLFMPNMDEKTKGATDRQRVSHTGIVVGVNPLRIANASGARGGAMTVEAEGGPDSWVNSKTLAFFYPISSDVHELPQGPYGLYQTITPKRDFSGLGFDLLKQILPGALSFASPASVKIRVHDALGAKGLFKKIQTQGVLDFYSPTQPSTPLLQIDEDSFSYLLVKNSYFVQGKLDGGAYSLWKISPNPTNGKFWTKNLFEDQHWAPISQLPASQISKAAQAAILEYFENSKK